MYAPSFVSRASASLRNATTVWAASAFPALLARANELGFRFIAGQRPQANNTGHIPTTMEWARKLSKDDIGVLNSKAPYSETVPNVDEGFSKADLKDPQ